MARARLEFKRGARDPRPQIGLYVYQAIGRPQQLDLEPNE